MSPPSVTTFVALGGGGDEEGVVYTNGRLCDTVMAALNEQRAANTTLCDVILEVSGEQFYAHRGVLAANSAYFSGVLSSGHCRKVAPPSPTHLRLPDVGAFASALRYMYTGYIEVMSTNLSTLLGLSATLQIPDLASACVAHMKATLSIATWRDLLITCATFSLDALANDVVAFVAENADSADMTCLSETHFGGVLQHGSRSAEWSLAALLDWTAYDYDTRCGTFAELACIIPDLNKLSVGALQRQLDRFCGHRIATHPFLLELGQKAVLQNSSRQRKELQLTKLPLKKRNSLIAVENEPSPASTQVENMTSRDATALSLCAVSEGTISRKVTRAAKGNRCSPANIDADTSSSTTERKTGAKRPRRHRKDTRPQRLTELRDTQPSDGTVEDTDRVTACTQTTQCHSDGEFAADEVIVNVEVTEQAKRGKKKAGVAYPCGRCPRTFNTPSALHHHERGHGSATPFLCEICGFSTVHFASMNVHRRQHNGTKFKCPLEDCSYSSIRRSRLEDHMSAHAGLKNFVCSACGKAFTSRKHMQRHEKIHAPQALACTDCDYRSNRRDKLKEHVSRHHLETAVREGYLTAEEAADVVLRYGKRKAKQAKMNPPASVPPNTWPDPAASLLSDEVIQYLASMATCGMLKTLDTVAPSQQGDSNAFQNTAPTQTCVTPSTVVNAQTNPSFLISYYDL